MRFLKHLLLAATVVLIGNQVAIAQAASLKVVELKTEYRRNPIGLDVAKPRFSWQLRSTRRNVKQSAYRITTRTAAGLLWDSGKIDSDQSLHVEYGGRALQPLERVSWRVRVWDDKGNSAVSKPATFETGLLSSDDWADAQWIGMGASEAARPVVPDPKAMRWIWYPDKGDLTVNAPSGKRGLRRDFALTDRRTVQRAFFVCAIDAGGVVWINSQKVGECSGYDPPLALDIAEHLKAGDNRVDVLARNGGEAAGALAQIVVEYGKSETDILRISTDGKWQAALLKDKAETIPPDAQWKKVRVLGRVGEGQYWGGVKMKPIALGQIEAPTYLRREFKLAAKPKQARLSATALGIYEIRINGKRVGDEYFSPGWTDYRQRLQVQTYDVSRYLKRGKNVIAATLADGWFAGYIGWGRVRNFYGPYPLRLKAQLNVLGRNAQSISTDSDWKASFGPVLFSDIFKGERYDARKEMPGWDKPSFDDSAWKPVDAVQTAALEPKLVSEPGGQVRVTQTLKPVAITEPRPGVHVFDMGQNMVGWVRLRVRGPAGTKVRIRHAEMLNPDGTVYTTNLRLADAIDEYTLSGRGNEVWEPRFTFHGFRYVELTGFPGKPSRKNITGLVAHSDIPSTLSFSTDNKLINQLQSNIDWGQRGNFLSVPTDCPQRDERLGWMGDAQVFIGTACRNRDVAAFFTKWVRDVNDAQSKEGAFTNVAPASPGMTGLASPAWGDAGVIVPWTLFQCYADRRLLAEALPHMAAWVDHLHGSNPQLLWRGSRGADFGDWLSIKAKTDKEVLATAFFAYSAKLVAESAAVLGKTQMASHYQKLFDKIAAAFVKAYVDPKSGKIQSDTQTLYALALRFGLLPPDLQEKAGQHLVNDVKGRGNHLSTGFIGVSHLLPALSQIGRHDVAYDLLQQKTFPSWLYSVLQGATTIWERWDGWTHDKGFQSPSMNSFNHYSFGSVGEWMYSTVGGLQSRAPAWKKIRVAPVPGGDLKRATTEMKTPYGPLVSRWVIKNGQFKLRVEIPANTEAEIHVPGQLKKAPRGLNPFGDGNVFSVGSGRWDFVSSL